MVTLNIYHEYAEELDKELRLKYFPLAVKLLEKEEDIPEGAKRPLRDLGHHLPLCQAFQMSRSSGTLLAMLKEDMWCFEPVISLGLAEPPQYLLDGHARFPYTLKTLEASRNWVRSTPRLELGKYIGIASSPLKTANFDPDVVMVYCNPYQCKQLLLAAGWEQGRDVTSTVTGHAGTCLYTFVPAIQTGEYQVTVPCGGDYKRAACAEDQLIFTAPKGKLESLMSGFRYLVKRGLRGPLAPTLMPEYEMIESFMKIGKELGYM